MKDKIIAMVKRPGMGNTWEKVEVDNQLNALQQLVGGYLETITIRDDIVLLFDEEGVIKALEPNMYVRGHWIRGPIVAVGVDGEEFDDCPAQTPWKMRVAISLANGL